MSLNRVGKRSGQSTPTDHESQYRTEHRRCHHPSSMGEEMESLGLKEPV